SLPPPDRATAEGLAVSRPGFVGPDDYRCPQTAGLLVRAVVPETDRPPCLSCCLPGNGRTLALWLPPRELWNADETRGPVFQVLAGKVGYRWYMWLFESKDAVVFTLDKGRAHEVPEAHFGEQAKGLVVDRYKAYKAMKHVKEGRLILAFCLAHPRRDFLDV